MIQQERPRKILGVDFYCESNGNEPVRKWLKSLEKESRSIIGKDICTVQEGWPLGMPLVRSLGSGLRIGKFEALFLMGLRESFLS